MYGTNSVTVTQVPWGDITGGTTGSDYRIIVTTPAGTEATVTGPTESYKGKSGRVERRVGPGLYFKYVKSKLLKVEQEKLKVRLLRLQVLTKDAAELGQQALYEEYAKTMAIIVRENEAAVCGFDRWIPKDDIEKYMRITKEDGANKSPVYFKILEEFPRSIPTKIRTQLRDVQDKKLFDKIWVLYLDYVGTELKTNKEKIRQKDPIAFGQFAYAKDRFYFICDWVDEYCDLTLEKFIEKLDPEYTVNKTPEIDEKFIEKIKKEVLDRQARLDGTKASNYKSKMDEEDLEKLKEELRAEVQAEKKPWWRFW